MSKKIKCPKCGSTMTFVHLPESMLYRSKLSCPNEKFREEHPFVSIQAGNFSKKKKEEALVAAFLSLYVE